MHYSGRMGRSEAIEYLGKPCVNRLGGQHLLSFEHAAKTFAFDQLHYQKGSLSRQHAVIKDGDDVVMLYPAGGLRLAFKSSQRISIAKHRSAQYLYRDRTI